MLKQFPDDYNEFREVFVGGGSIFFSIPANKTRWINDINQDLIAFYLSLQNDNNFIDKCRQIRPQQEEEKVAPPVYNIRLKEIFSKLIEKRFEDRGLSYFFINRTVWGGRVNYDVPSRLYFSNPQGWNVVEDDTLEKCKEILFNTKITCVDYSEVLSFNGENVFCYCDPPYYFQTSTNKGSQLYQHCFSEQDHVRLRDCIKDCKHKVLLSYDDCGFIRELYKDFNIREENWKYCGSSMEKKALGSELLIANY